MLVFETLKNKKSDFLNSNTCQYSRLYGMWTTCFELGIFMYWTRNSMNNLLSFTGLVDTRVSASEKNLPVRNSNSKNIWPIVAYLSTNHRMDQSKPVSLIGWKLVQKLFYSILNQLKFIYSQKATKFWKKSSILVFDVKR